MLESTEMVDPRSAHPQPPFKSQKKLDIPARSGDMNPQPDHGEKSYRGTGRLKDRVAIITGADSGIGRAIAIAYAREGADVVIGYHSSEDDAKETAKWVEEAGRRAWPVSSDVREEKSCNELVVQPVKKFGKLDILINNAAYQETHDSIQDMSAELFDRIFKTNVYGPFFLSKAALRHMKPGGSIIITSSIQGYDPTPMLLPYSMTKSALLGMTKGLAGLAMESNGVRVNAVAPGPVWTPLIPSTMPEAKFRTFGQDTVFGRPAQPVELAPIYVWLASSEASYVTGEVYGCTGGKTPV